MKTGQTKRIFIFKSNPQNQQGKQNILLETSAFSAGTKERQNHYLF